MALDVSEAVKTGFGSLKTDVGQKLIGIFFLIQAVNFGSTFIIETGSTALQLLGGLLITVSALASIAATIGGLRSFRENMIGRDFFTDNLLWPFARTLGANLTTGIFAYLIGAIFLLPAFLAALGGTTASSVGAGALSGASITGIALGALGVILGFAAFIYVIITLILAQPLIAIDDKRMFQALDESIQRTKDNKLSIFLAGIAVLIVYFLLAMIGGLASVANEQIGAALIQLIVVPIFTPIFLALLNHFSEELPLE